MLLIVFLVENPFTEWQYQRFGIDLLKNKNYEIKILDFTKLINPKIYELHKHAIYKCPQRKEIVRKEDLNRALEGINVDTTIAFDHLQYNSYSKYVRDFIFKNKKALRAVWDLGLNPMPKLSVWTKLRQLLLRKNLIQRVKNYVGPQIYYYKHGAPDIALLSGKLSDVGSNKSVKHKIWVHAFDYDKYLVIKNKNQGKRIMGNYACYLDEDFISDLLILGYRPIITPDKFYPTLNKILSNIEEILGCKVIIAAHPKSDSSVLKLKYNNRRVVKGSTAELVRDSKIVLGHASAGFNFAMLWRKPICILTSNELNKSYYGPFIFARAATTRTTVINIDHEYSNLDKIMKQRIKNNLYDDYLENYIKTENSKKLCIWDIFSKYIIKYVIKSN